MISRIQRRLGPAGFIVAVIALVAALAGGAYAASGGLSGKQKKEVEKISKKFAGKPGAVGPAGSTGPAGAPGAKGDAGAAGKDGTNGTNGTNGKSVKSETASVAECTEGGTKFEIEGSGTSSHVCNGSGGGGGEAVFPTLPSGKTETGTWFATGAPGLSETATAISFPIPLAAADAAAIVVHISPDAACTGSVDAPTAPAGSICVYNGVATGTNEISEVLKPSDFLTEGVGTGGALLFGGFLSGESETGSFAITAP